MAISSLFHQWCHLFLPYQNFAIFYSLLDFFTELTLYKSVTAQRKVYLLNLLYLPYILQNVYLWAFPPSPMDSLRQGDIVSIFILPDIFYLALVALFSLTPYFINLLCFTMKPAFLRLLEDTLFRDRNGTLDGVGYRTKSGQATARYIFLGLANLLHVFLLVIDGSILFLVYTLLSTAMENPSELFGSPLRTPFTFAWNVAWIILNYWTKTTIATLHGKILIYVTVLSAGLLIILFRRLFHNESILAVYRQRKSIFSWAPFRQYLVNSRKTVQILFTVNDICGRIFLAFLVVNMPISAWILVHLSLGDQSRSSVILLSAMYIHDLLVCILLHLAIAKLTKRLHAPSKMLLTLNAATGHRVGNFRARLLLHHTIVRLHTKAKYGITYGSVGGLITMGSFAKCMLLHTELLMYAYKLVRHI